MTQQFHKPERIEPIGSEVETRKIQAAETSEDLSAPSKVKFDEAFARADPSKVMPREIPPVEGKENTSPNKPSLLELVGKTTNDTQVPKVTTENLVEQATKLRERIETPRAVLMGASDELIAQLPQGAVSTLSGHVDLMDRGLKDALSQVKGVEVGSLVETGKPPLYRFLHFLTESDKRLSNVVGEIKALDATKETLTPTKLMAVQIKLGFVQQELEFFTNVLNKALESTKTIMNVQI